MALPNNMIFSIMKYGILTFFVLLLFSCNNENKVENEIAKIPVSVKIVRFDKAFSAASPANLPKLKTEYPGFFPKQYHDSIWVQKLTDTLQNQLEAEVLKSFPKDEKLTAILHPLFQHIKYYFPDFNTPQVFATTSDVDYRNKVIATDSMLIIGLDNYLGSDHRFYTGIEKYISKEMNPSQIGPDVAETYARMYITPPHNNTFLGQIIYYGKMLYLKDVWLTNIPDSQKIAYTEEEYEWAENNELYMWRYFVEKELLYSTDPKLGDRFIGPAPFSKFYLAIDNDSPGMLGRYLGWKIVRAYMQNNDVTVQELMGTDAKEIFTNSKYKPKK